jgi:hypothetical protein
MGERYYITGVQIGMILAWIKLGKIEEIQKILDEIQEKQFWGRTEGQEKGVEGK